VSHTSGSTSFTTRCGGRTSWSTPIVSAGRTAERQAWTEDIESGEGGLEDWLGALGAELREERYRPQAVRRVLIPKSDGGKRPLGIPTVRDRVVQQAAKLVVEPIFEADFEPNASR